MFILAFLFQLVLSQTPPQFADTYILHASTDIITGSPDRGGSIVTYYVDHTTSSFKQYTPEGVVFPGINGPQVGPYTYQEQPVSSGNATPTHFTWFFFVNTTCATETDLWHGGAFPFDHELIFVKSKYEGFEVIEDGTLVTKWSGCFIGSSSVTLLIDAYTGEWREIVHSSGYTDTVRMTEITADDFKTEITVPDFISSKCEN